MIEQWYQQALAHVDAARPDLAEPLLRKVLQKLPRNPEVNATMGLVLRRLKRYPQSEFHFQCALAAEPANAVYLNNYGNLLLETLRLVEARSCFERALAQTPDDPPPLLGLCTACIGLGDYEAAIVAGRRGVEVAPGHPRALANLGAALVNACLIQEAVPVHRAATEAAPESGFFVPGYLATLHYDETLEPSFVAAEHRRLAPRLLPPGAAEDPQGVALSRTPRDAGKRLRVGYLSSDFRSHSCAMFIEPILEHHERAAVEVRCYFTGEADSETARIKRKADRWLSVAGQSDDQLVATLRAERLDILVELNGHTEGSRLEALSRRVAPVQATYLGYPNTTGVPNIDYRIVDAITDPAGPQDADASEKLVRLDRCFLCFRPRDDAPPVASVDAQRPVRFGSFNAGFKVSTDSLRTWGRVVAATPGSVLVLKNKHLGDAGVRTRLLAVLAQAGVSADRVELLPSVPGVAEHLSLYAQVDIALDCWPYNGTTTTCEALWMGVPVIGLRGRAHVSRVGESLLGTVGLSDLVAGDADEFVQVATRLAADRGRLATLRSTLRDRVRASPLCDAAGMARAMERAMRAMWAGTV